MNLAKPDFTSYRLCSSDCLSDRIGLSLERALSVIKLGHEQLVDAAALAVIEYEIRDAMQLAEVCKCKIDNGGAS